MRLTLSALILAALVTPALADNSTTHDCSRTPSININEGDGNYKFVGACTKIVINGGDNRVTIESVKSLYVTGTENVINIDVADAINVTGAENKITYRKGLTTPRPKISIVGTDNAVSKIK